VAGFYEHGNEISGFTNAENFMTGNIMFTETGRLDSSLTHFVPNAAALVVKKKERKKRKFGGLRGHIPMLEQVGLSVVSGIGYCFSDDK
jgi:hypothetical protein